MKIIKGLNGAGKTLYSKQELMNDKETFVFDSNMMQWYEPKNGTFSQLNFLNKKYINKIKEIEKRILSKDSKPFKEILNKGMLTITNIKTILKNNIFNNYKIWLKHEKDHKFVSESLVSGASILLKPKAKIANLKKMKEKMPEVLDNIIIYLQLKEIQFEWKNQQEDFPTKDALVGILKTLEDRMEPYLEYIGDFTYKEIIFALNNGIHETYDGSIDYFKQLIIYSEDFMEIKSLMNEYEAKIKKAFKFNKKIKGVSEDGMKIKINPGSRGEITSKCLESYVLSLRDNYEN